MTGGLDASKADPSAVGKNQDPYAAAMLYGQKAQKNVQKAVSNANQALATARDMISKMMSLKPWAQISRYGREVEEAGIKTQEYAKLARPFIYSQVSAKGSAVRHSP